MRKYISKKLEPQALDPVYQSSIRDLTSWPQIFVSDFLDTWFPVNSVYARSVAYRSFCARVLADVLGVSSATLKRYITRSEKTGFLEFNLPTHYLMALSACHTSALRKRTWEDPNGPWAEKFQGFVIEQAVFWGKLKP